MGGVIVLASKVFWMIGGSVLPFLVFLALRVNIFINVFSFDRWACNWSML